MNHEKLLNTMLDDRYDMQEVIGIGGMAVIYKALDTRLNRYVAIKVLKDEYAHLQDDFFKFATAKGMVGIKGHRLVGGFRASTYNALPLESAEALVACMKEYEQSQGI